MAVELRTVAADGTPDAILPDWSDLSFNQDFAPGALSFTYALAGRNANLLGHGTELVCLLDGAEPADGRFIINQAQSTNLAEQDAVSTYALPSLRQLFDKLLIGPSLASTTADSGTAGSPGYWTGVTAGQLLIEAIQYGIVRARAALGLASSVNPLKWLTWPITSFSASTDSAGQAWPSAPLIDYSAAPGDTVSTVIGFLADGGFADVRMQGHSLQAYGPGHFGADLTTGANPVVLITGRDFTDATYQTDSGDLVNALLVIGGTPSGATAPACVWRYDTASINQFGYREGTISVAQVSTVAVLNQIGDRYLSYLKQVRWSYTYSQAASYLEQATNPFGSFRPFLDFKVGDTILIMDGSQFITDRVRALAAGWPSATKASVALTINDFFAEREVELAQRLKSIGG